jgi:hypothetical protein
VTQAWPLTGSLQGATVHGEFTGLAGLSGQWLRPDADITITQVGFPLNQSLDAAAPVPSDPSVPGWSSTDFIAPIVRLTDTASVAQLQDWIVASAVGLGVGGSMLASLLFEWLRPHPAHADAREPTRPSHATPPGPPSPEPASRWSKPTAVLIGAGLVMIWIRTRRDRRTSLSREPNVNLTSNAGHAFYITQNPGGVHEFVGAEFVFPQARDVTDIPFHARCRSGCPGLPTV